LNVRGLGKIKEIWGYPLFLNEKQRIEVLRGFQEIEFLTEFGGKRGLQENI